MDEFRVGELFSKFYGEVALKTKIPDTGEMHLNVILKYFNKFTLKILSVKLRFVFTRVFTYMSKTMCEDFCL